MFNCFKLEFIPPLFFIFTLFFIPGCDSESTAPPVFYNVSGTVIGLKQDTDTVMLQNSDGQSIEVSNSYSSQLFFTLTEGSSYFITAINPTDNSGCIVNNNSGENLSTNIENVEVVCSPITLPCTDELACVSTIAGTNISGFTDGDALTMARFNKPRKIATDPTDGSVYIIDFDNNKIRKLSADGTKVSTYAGNGATAYRDSDNAPDASFNYPEGITVDPNNGSVYIADTGNNVIRRIEINPSNQAIGGKVSTYAGCLATGGAPCATGAHDGDSIGSSFYSPRDLDIDPADGSIYVADSGNNKIRRIAPSLDLGLTGGLVSSYAGCSELEGINGQCMPGNLNGPADSALFNSLLALAISPDGILYAGQSDDNIRKITKNLNNESIGDTVSYFTENQQVLDIAVDSNGTLFIGRNTYVYAVSSDGAIYAIDNQTPGNVDGPYGHATFNTVSGVSISIDGSIIVADTNNNKLRKITNLQQ